VFWWVVGLSFLSAFGLAFVVMPPAQRLPLAFEFGAAIAAAVWLIATVCHGSARLARMAVSATRATGLGRRDDGRFFPKSRQAAEDVARVVGMPALHVRGMHGGMNAMLADLDTVAVTLSLEKALSVDELGAVFAHLLCRVSDPQVFNYLQCGSLDIGEGPKDRALVDPTGVHLEVSLAADAESLRLYQHPGSLHSALRRVFENDRETAVRRVLPAALLYFAWPGGGFDEEFHPRERALAGAGAIAGVGHSPAEGTGADPLHPVSAAEAFPASPGSLMVSIESKRWADRIAMVVLSVAGLAVALAWSFGLRWPPLPLLEGVDPTAWARNLAVVFTILTILAIRGAVASPRPSVQDDHDRRRAAV
jgi:hypothetical protein